MSEATETQSFAEALDNSLDAALGELKDTEVEDAALLATEDDSEEESDGEAEATPSEEAPAEEPKADGKLPSYADAVRQIEQALGPQVAEVVRRTQAEGSRKTQQFATYKAQVEDLIKEVQSLKESSKESKPAEPDADDQLLQQMSQRDQKLMDAYLRKCGYVRQDEIAATETSRKSSDFVRAETERAAQEFGERFAKKDGEQFVFDEDVQGRMTEVMQRLEDEARGVTPADLFVLANWRQMMQEAEERGKATVKAAPKPNGKPEPPKQKGIVTARSTGGRPQTGVVYRRGKDHPVKDFESVLDRALALSRQEMRERL